MSRAGEWVGTSRALTFNIVIVIVIIVIDMVMVIIVIAIGIIIVVVNVECGGVGLHKSGFYLSNIIITFVIVVIFIAIIIVIIIIATIIIILILFQFCLRKISPLSDGSDQSLDNFSLLRAST